LIIVSILLMVAGSILKIVVVIEVNIVVLIEGFNSTMKSIKTSSRSPMRMGGSTLHWKGRVVGKC
jgi:hypothetical protein